ncbi:hypothetical protein [Pseudanabaena sp. FACHB-2040]|uniref:hypothetical protein n=1 Tax=Pseudanabaena sp. FACHB-2040 TaxID=2692859 RepID=UPI001688F348|nr:hypothetical protein [Pseudanabaena sp. FACHB-2040]MBD2258620.1 hypothetical protein [Pseudanabaena sp. FACHB-2040]
MPKFIVYACPTGELASQVQRFFEESRRVFGPNAAHAYMPHCTLLSFFEETPNSVPLYTQSLTRAYKRALRSQPTPAIAVTGFAFRPDWHGLELASPWLRQLMVNFASTTHSPTRKGGLRLKDWLHLSLAYEFSPDQAKGLSQMATELIDPAAAVTWELRYYQRNQDDHWICHQVLPLT